MLYVSKLNSLVLWLLVTPGLLIFLLVVLYDNPFLSPDQLPALPVPAWLSHDLSGLLAFFSLSLHAAWHVDLLQSIRSHVSWLKKITLGIALFHFLTSVLILSIFTLEEILPFFGLPSRSVLLYIDEAIGPIWAQVLVVTCLASLPIVSLMSMIAIIKYAAKFSWIQAIVGILLFPVGIWYLHPWLRQLQQQQLAEEKELSDHLIH